MKCKWIRVGRDNRLKVTEWACRNCGRHVTCGGRPEQLRPCVAQMKEAA